eukprot:scaffold61129_cov70-Phaeocystis_antarctica.AAC.3
MELASLLHSQRACLEHHIADGLATSGSGVGGSSPLWFRRHTQPETQRACRQMCDAEPVQSTRSMRVPTALRHKVTRVATTRPCCARLLQLLCFLTTSRAVRAFPFRSTVCD